MMKFQRRARQEDDRGVTPQQMLIGVALFAAGSLLVVGVESERLQRQRAGLAGSQFAKFYQGTQTYVSNNGPTLLGLTAGGPVVATPAMLQATGDLPTSWRDTNAFGQQHLLLVAQSPPGTLLSVAVTTGGLAIPDSQAPRAAMVVDADGGVIPSDNPSIARGVVGGWSLSLAPFTATGAVPSSGHLAATSAWRTGVASQWLSRIDTGNPEDGTMRQGVNMGGNAITNASSVQIGDQTLQQPQAKMVNEVFAGNYNANSGTLTVAQDLQLGSMGNQKASRGFYFAGIYASGDPVPKPTCPSGSAPEIYAVPAAYSDNGVGSAISAVQVNASNINATTWSLTLRVRTENGWVVPTATYGRLAAFTRCGP